MRALRLKRSDAGESVRGRVDFERQQLEWIAGMLNTMAVQTVVDCGRCQQLAALVGWLQDTSSLVVDLM